MPTDRPLRAVAGERAVDVGAAVDADRLRTDVSYRALVRDEFTVVTAENALKMGPLRPAPSTYDFADADAIVNFARAHEMPVRGHTLVWHNQTPTWFQSWDYTDDQLRRFLREHVQTVVGRYRRSVGTWDVVNEAVDDDGSMRETVWYDAMGEEYLDRAFEWAAEVNPDADRYYNDYGADAVNEKSDAVYDLLGRLLDRGVPVDGVGLQLHALGDWPDPDSIAENVRRFQDLGLDVQITEMDVAFPAGEVPHDAAERQADYYREVVETCLDTGVETLVTWGVRDGDTWLRAFRDFPERFSGDPLLFDDRGQRKPAYDAVRDVLST
ncbi:endo-1,4-beta-xylanase [Halomarina oriensis]|uniref:endo-1,4-beta-xylanase n=1 Tax=Halomarina oriensis TaxID=671145 RepID=A0A6B0GF57_9EURY|nr:endo-1,4-beta-xylanase [Halomarina oriensis]MWG33462.1 1,4-beta-xylanase [Halomarina oriensis]